MAKKAEQFIQTAMDNWRLAATTLQPQLDREQEDLSFQVPANQWDEDARKMRAAIPPGKDALFPLGLPARPMLSVSTLDEPIQLILNQEKAAHLGVHIHAHSEDASDDTAQILQGLYHDSEVSSRAGNVRSWAFDRAVKCGRGWYRLDKAHDPDGGDDFDQKIIFKRFYDQSCCYPDPSSTEPDFSDGEFFFVVEDLRWNAYKRKYGKSKLSKFTDSEFVTLGTNVPNWVGQAEDQAKRTIRIAEYWRVEVTTRIKVLLEDGTKAFQDELPDDHAEITASMPIDERKVYCSIINGVETLEPEQEWDGQYIPMIPMIGRELQPFDGEHRWIGLITNAKDGARLTNYAASNAVSMSALEPRAPFSLDPKQIENYEAWWKQANTRDFPYLPSHAFDANGQPWPKPERLQADMSRLGPSMALLNMGRDFVQQATSTYDPSLGKAPTAHRSGRAIVALQDQTTVGTSHYLDNEANISMMYESRVWLDLCGKIIDRPGRIIRTRDAANKTQYAMVKRPYTIDPKTKRPQAVMIPDPQNPGQTMPAPPDHPALPDGAKYHDFSKGIYGVEVSIGKSNTSRLQEGNDSISQLLQADPQLIVPLGPEWMKFQDYPGAPAIQAILTKMRDHAMPFLADGPPDAAAQLAQAKAQAQQMQQMIQELQQKLQGKVVENQGKLAVQESKNAADTFNAQADREVKLAVAEEGAKTERMDLFLEERARVGVQGHAAGMAAIDRAHEVGAAAMDHSQTTQQADQGHQQALEQGQQTADLAPTAAPEVAQ